MSITATRFATPSSYIAGDRSAERLLLAIGAAIGGGHLYIFAVLAVGVNLTATPYTTTLRSR